MEDPEYAFSVVKKHFEKFAVYRVSDSPVVLELGPDDSLFSAMIACALRVSCIYLIDVDVDDFARKDLHNFRDLSDEDLQIAVFDVLLKPNLE